MNWQCAFFAARKVLFSMPQLVPQTERKGAFFQELAALGAFARLIPQFHVVGGRDRTLESELKPSAIACSQEGKATDGFLETRSPRRVPVGG